MEILLKLGLTEEEAELYLALLEHGAMSASDIAKVTTIKRTYAYKIAEDLAKKGMLVHELRDKATMFVPTSPDSLLSLVEAKKYEANQAEREVEAVLASLKAKYTSIEARPIITTYEGVQGLKKIYKVILDQAKELLLFRSIYDESKPELGEVVHEQITKQVQKGIQVKTLTPLAEDTKETYLTKDKDRLVQRHIIHKNKLELPSQIMIFEDKVAIISLKNEIVSTLIENKDVADTFSTMFEFMWDHTTEEHEEIVAQWSKTGVNSTQE